MSKISSVTFFQNGNTMVFDDAGNQMPELQEAWILLWCKHAESLGHDVTEIKDMIMPNQKYAKVFRTDNDNLNWSLGHF